MGCHSAATAGAALGSKFSRCMTALQCSIGQQVLTLHGGPAMQHWPMADADEWHVVMHKHQVNTAMEFPPDSWPPSCWMIGVYTS
jgi:hypothetical protein